MRHSLNALGEVLEHGEWPQLRLLDLAQNNIPAIDESLARASAVQTVNLSKNLIRTVENLTWCPALSCLDLGFNYISSVANIHLEVGNIRTLILCNNNIAK
jgi:Leucine-rich repeat (LRR) protein